jgi:putative DNA methylase
VLADALANWSEVGLGLEAGGDRAAAYADAIPTYLGLGFSRLGYISNPLTLWDPTKEQVRYLFARRTLAALVIAAGIG